MRFAMFLGLAFLLMFPPAKSIAQTEDSTNTVRPEMIRNMIRIIRATRQDEKLYQRFDHSDPGVGGSISGALSEFRWKGEWCEYRRLSQLEVAEMFNLRLRNFPQLRSEASRVLGRNIGRDGFGFHLDPYFYTDYAVIEDATRTARRLLRDWLKENRVNLSDC